MLCKKKKVHIIAVAHFTVLVKYFGIVNEQSIRKVCECSLKKGERDHFYSNRTQSPFLVYIYEN